jgi:two-component system OmpR family response regulator
LVTLGFGGKDRNQSLQRSWAVAPKGDYNRAMADSPHVLIVDDDREIRDLLSRFLTRHGLRVDSVADGRAMFQRLETGRFDLVVLDLMLPGDDGLTLCRRLRVTSNLPVIMLTAVGEDTDRVVGLEMGADDYVTKPFSPRELLARIKAVLRRASHPPAAGGLTFAGWKLDPARRQLHDPAKRLVALTSGEFDLLLAFVERPQRVLSRDQLLDLTKGRDALPFDRSIDVQLSRLRRKIEADPKAPELIKTVRGGGYMFTPEVEASP